jgi:CRP-like cAMP-binding protein
MISITQQPHRMEATETFPEPLRKLQPADLQALATPLELGRGDWLFRQSDRPSSMFYVSKGEVLLQRQGEQGDNLVLQRVREGFVAEASLQSTSYHCDGLATAAGMAVAVPIGPLQTSLARDPAFALRWIGMLNMEVRRLRAQCERLSLKSVQARLLHLIDAEGVQGRLQVRSGLKSLAAELAVTHEALYRAIAVLEKKGAIGRDSGTIHLRRIARAGAA